EPILPEHCDQLGPDRPLYATSYPARRFRWKSDVYSSLTQTKSEARSSKDHSRTSGGGQKGKCSPSYADSETFSRFELCGSEDEEERADFEKSRRRKASCYDSRIGLSASLLTRSESRYRAAYNHRIVDSSPNQGPKQYEGPETISLRSCPS